MRLFPLSTPAIRLLIDPVLRPEAICACTLIGRGANSIGNDTLADAYPAIERARLTELSN